MAFAAFIAVAGAGAVTPSPTPPSALDTRKTSPEKLEKLRELANEMLQQAAREPQSDAMQKIAMFSERMHRILDGEFL